MTFDEALKIYDDPDVEDLIETWEVVDVIEQLRKEYAPTVEMPDFALSCSNVTNVSSTSIPLVSGSMYSSALMHPETIKVVDE